MVVDLIVVYFINGLLNWSISTCGPTSKSGQLPIRTHLLNEERKYHWDAIHDLSSHESACILQFYSLVIDFRFHARNVSCMSIMLLMPEILIFEAWLLMFLMMGMVTNWLPGISRSERLKSLSNVPNSLIHFCSMHLFFHL